MKLLNSSLYPIRSLALGLMLLGVLSLSFAFGATQNVPTKTASVSTSSHIRVADGQETHGRHAPIKIKKRGLA